MKQYKVIAQLCLIGGQLKCKKPSNRSFQKAHFKQGDLMERVVHIQSL
jgi:hypothetical protein